MMEKFSHFQHILSYLSARKCELKIFSNGHFHSWLLGNDFLEITFKIATSKTLLISLSLSSSHQICIKIEARERESVSKVVLISRAFSSCSKAIKLNIFGAVAIKNQIMEIFTQLCSSFCTWFVTCCNLKWS